MIDDIFVARQPIYNKSNTLIGYELLYRASDTDVAEFTDGQIASSEVILNSFMNIGLDGLVGSAKAFINIPVELVIDESFSPMFENQTVLEILEDVKPTADVIAGVKRLKEQGYEIALDDFKYTTEHEPLLELADYVKIDVVVFDADKIERQLRYIENFNIELIAEKIETQEIYESCEKLGFDYFQGFYFCRPQLVKKKNTPSNKVVVLNILNKLENTDYDLDDIENTLALDAVLTFKILRYVNSAAFAQRKEIESIKEALILVGGNTIKKWATLILMTHLMEGKPQALFVTALVRARMCELIAEYRGANGEQMFTIGLLSLVDALMDTPMVDLLDELALSTPVKLALLNYDGDSGWILKNVIDYEKGEWNDLLKQGVDAKDYLSCYMEAVKWADSTVESLT